MVDLENVALAIREPYRFCRYFNKLYFSARNRNGYNRGGISFFDEDWDNLVLLDACRYDMFAEENTIQGRLERKMSKASATPEYIESNLRNRTLHDVVYVSANGYLTHLRDEYGYEFHALYDFFDPEYWDDAYQTVMPEVLTEQAREIVAEYPDKRIVVHYIQPHWPFISDLIDDTLEEISNYDDADRNFWDEYRSNEYGLTNHQLRTAYRDTLQRTLPAVEQLLDSLSGKTVVSSDHGQMLGERSFPVPIREYGHPTQTYTPELVDIPWLVVEDGGRKSVTAEPPVDESTNPTDSNLVKERLRQLGYAE